MITSGEKIRSADVLNLFKYQVIYTGSDLNFSVPTGSAGTVTASVELTAIPSTALSDSTYALIECNQISRVGNSTDHISPEGAPQVKLQLQAKNTGGSYSDSMATTIIHQGQGNADYFREQFYHQVCHLHTLTPDEKTDGVQFKALTYGVTTNDSLAQYLGKFITVKLIP